MISCAAFFSGRSSLLGVRLPTPHLTLLLIVLVGYGHYRGVFLSPTRSLLLTFVAFALFSRHSKLALAGVAALLVDYACLYTYDTHSGRVPGYKSEPREYLFSLSCLLYAVELYAHAANRRCRENTVRVDSKKKLMTRVAGPILYVGLATVLAGCLVLTLVGYFRSEITTASVERTLARIKANSPIDPAAESSESLFDVYFDQGQLIYVKIPCVRADEQLAIYLHIFPRDANALSNHRSAAGFDNLDFGHLTRDSVGRCVATITLPDYDIGRVNTGTYSGRWRATLEFDE